MKKIYLSIAAALAWASSSAQAQDTMVWRDTITSGTLSSTANYYIEGTTTRPGSVLPNLVFDGPADVTVTSAAAATLTTINVRGNTSSFTVDGTAAINFKQGINIASGVNATFGINISRYNDVGYNLRLDIGNNGSLNLATLSMGSTAGKEGELYKTGKGTLSIGTKLTGGSATKVFFQEGIVELRNNADITLGSNSSVIVNLGDATGATTAILRGYGTINATLTTAGTGLSILDAGAGALTLANVNATSGATLRFNLDSFNTIGGTSFTGNNLLFDFSGGVASQTYTLLNFTSATIDFDSITLNPDYILDASFGNNGWLLQNGNLQVRFAAVPEPGALTFISLSAVTATLITLRRRNTPRPA